MAGTEFVWSTAMNTFLIEFYRDYEAVMLRNEVVHGVDRRQLERQMVSDFSAEFGFKLDVALFHKKWKNIRDMVGRCSLKMKKSQKPTDSERKLYERYDSLHRYITHKTVSEAQCTSVVPKSNESCKMDESRMLVNTGETNYLENSVGEVVEECVEEIQMEWQDASYLQYEHDYFQNYVRNDNETLGNNYQEDAVPQNFDEDMVAGRVEVEDSIPIQRADGECDNQESVNMNFPKKPKKK
ncbi:hypothetical protein QAD02_003268 [Eretmocerus hayati]|uniref:Uncharacterized protein n=1 Tax=Eretmocerus hayati TaxID=131215 RepID=A0ACC2NL70_9HYME|nr:hypothetical protein QAD02_003268 [Eretmocerus hayati]